MKRWIGCLLLMLILTGCSGKVVDEKIKDLDFTVVEEAEVPTELLEEIESRKNGPFHMSYSCGEDLYIVVGYGMQETGGYSIQVPQFYLTENAIVLETKLIGPKEKEAKVRSYPYLVIKTENREEPIVYL